MGPVIAGIAALVATFSLATTAYFAVANWSRSRKQATLEAWTRWIQDSLEDRRAFTSAFGQNTKLNKEQAESILDGGTFTIEDKIIDEEASKKLRRNIQRGLSGLERLAVGVEQQIYDVDVILEIGGTLVVGTFNRYKPYIEYLQTHPKETVRHIYAYRSLQGLVAEVEGSKTKRRRYDQARIAKMKRSASSSGT